MLNNELPSQEYLKECLTYYPNTGALVWNIRPTSHFKNEGVANSWNTRWANTEAFTNLDDKGYLTGCIDNKHYKAHRVIWKILYNTEPEQIDHDDRVRSNNAQANLVAANNTLNSRNRSKRSDNSSGVTGVYFEARSQKWVARLNRKFLGYFDTFEAAVQARKAAQNQSGYHINHGV